MDVMNFVSENWLAVGVGTVIVGLIVMDRWKKYSKKKKLNKSEKEIVVAKDKILNEPVAQPVIQQVAQQNTFADKFSQEDLIPEDDKSMMERIRILNNDMESERDLVNKKTIQDLKMLNEDLAINTKNKEETRIQGVELGKLFDSYIRREKDLKITIANLEKTIIKHGVNEPRVLVDPVKRAPRTNFSYDNLPGRR